MAIVIDAALRSTELVPEQPKPHDASMPVPVTPTLSMMRSEALVGGRCHEASVGVREHAARAAMACPAHG